MKTEDYLCQACGVMVTRRVARGQRPKWCDGCRYRQYNVDPTKPCAACGDVGKVLRAGRYCSQFCQVYDRFGPQSRPVPLHHPSRRGPSEPATSPRQRKPPTQRICPRCAVSFMTNMPHQIHCSKRCAMKASRLRRRVREAGTYGDWTWGDFMRMAGRFRWCCAYCGIKPGRLDPDHVIPLSQGGPNVLTNLLPSCAACNTDKQALSLDEWALSRERRGLPPRATNWSPEDGRYRHLTWLRTVA